MILNILCKVEEKWCFPAIGWKFLTLTFIFTKQMSEYRIKWMVIGVLRLAGHVEKMEIVLSFNDGSSLFFLIISITIWKNLPVMFFFQLQGRNKYLSNFVLEHLVTRILKLSQMSSFYICFILLLILYIFLFFVIGCFMIEKYHAWQSYQMKDIIISWYQLNY